MAKWDKPGTGPGLGGSGGQGPPTTVNTGVNIVPFSPIFGSNPTGTGVEGESNAGIGVYGRSLSTVDPQTMQYMPGSGTYDGVRGESDGIGVHGVSHSTTGSGVWGEIKGSGNGTGNGVTGSANTSGGSGVWGVNTGGGNGVTGSAKTSAGSGVAGQNTGGGYGVSGSTSGGTTVSLDGVANGAGVWGDTNDAIGVRGTSTTGVGVEGSGGLFAGRFWGNVSVIGDQAVTGTITVNGDVVLTGGDCAEEFDISVPDRAEPGTVMIIDAGGVRPAFKAYDKRVAGVISGAGDLKPGIILHKLPEGNRAPIAMVGKVNCKVDAQYAAIEVGDLLTTSPTSGHAMKAKDPLHAFGAIIGKALRPLKEGQGLIPILVALQ